MNTLEKMPVFYSGFSGVIFEETKPWRRPHGNHGYGNFLAGVEESAVGIGGIISRLPNLAPLRRAARRVVNELNLGESLDSHPIRLEGSRERKAAILARASRQAVVGMLDAGNRIGVEIFHALPTDIIDAVSGHTPQFREDRRVVLGIVNNGQADACVDQFKAEAIRLVDEGRLVKQHFQNGPLGREFTMTGTSSGVPYSLSVLKLPSNTFEAGQGFADRLIHESTISLPGHDSTNPPVNQ